MGTETSRGMRYEFTYEDIQFLKRRNRPILGRIYRPIGDGPFPAVISVHGGAWTSGDRLVDAPTAERLATGGMVVLSIDFRMPPEAGYPESIADINFGIRWLKAQSGEYSTGVSRIGGIGFSSGGHQLMLCAMRPFDPRYAALPLAADPTQNSSLAFIVLCYAVLDPLARYRMAQNRKISRLLDAHHAYWPGEADMAEGNPQRILERAEAAQLPTALIIQGGVDDNLTPDMAQRFGAAYQNAGGRAEVLRYAHAPHGFIRREPESPEARAATTRILQFAFEHGGKAPP